MTAIAIHPHDARPQGALELSSDATLARRVASGDDAAYAAIYTRYHARIEAYCRAIVRHDEDARDAAQNAMAKALVAMRSQDETLHLRAWLYRIAHNESLTVLRRRRHHHELTDALERFDSDPVIEVLMREQLRAALDALGALPASHRQALLLRELGGLDYATVAESTGLTPRAARQAVFRARRAMRAERAAAEQSQCPEIRSVLASHDGRRRRARRVRAHLRTCAACREWDSARRPVRPRVVSVLPAAWATAASSLWGWVAGAVGGSSGSIGTVAATKLVTGAAILAAGAGPIAQHEIVHRERRPVTTHHATAPTTATATPTPTPTARGTGRPTTTATTTPPPLPAVSPRARPASFAQPPGSANARSRSPVMRGGTRRPSIESRAGDQGAAPRRPAGPGPPAAAAHIHSAGPPAR
jgi:RNA polymerase sigma factor (sigma-70 family)